MKTVELKKLVNLHVAGCNVANDQKQKKYIFLNIIR